MDSNDSFVCYIHRAKKQEKRQMMLLFTRIIIIIVCSIATTISLQINDLFLGVISQACAFFAFCLTWEIERKIEINQDWYSGTMNLK